MTWSIPLNHCYYKIGFQDKKTKYRRGLVGLPVFSVPNKEHIICATVVQRYNIVSAANWKLPTAQSAESFHLSRHLRAYPNIYITFLVVNAKSFLSSRFIHILSTFLPHKRKNHPWTKFISARFGACDAGGTTDEHHEAVIRWQTWCHLVDVSDNLISEQ